MKQDVAAYLSYLFPQMYSFDMMKLEKLGSRNIRAMIQILGSELKYLPEAIEKSEKMLEELSSGKVFNSLLAAEYGAKIASERMSYGNKKYVLSQLKMLASKAPDFRPLIPTLRTEEYLQRGADVMVYTRERGRNDFISGTKNWVCGKILQYREFSADKEVSIFTNNPLTENGDLDGHFITIPGTSPEIFRRDEFAYVKRLLSSQNNQSTEFYSSFFECCQRSSQINTIEQWHDYARIREIILDQSIEEISDEDLEKENLNILGKMYEVTRPSISYKNCVEEIAKSMNIKLDWL